MQHYILIATGVLAIPLIIQLCFILLKAFLRKGRERAPHDDLAYRLRDDFLSPAELSFCRVLQSAIGESATVCPKVRLSDLFFVATSDRSIKQTARNKIDRKHVDFVLCDPSTMQPLCGVELDDASHQRARQIETDKFKDAVFAAAGLPLVRFRASKSYVVADVAKAIEPHLTRIQRPSADHETVGRATTTPTCPQCGVDMVRRKARRGANAGNSFWGCANYPKCREVIDA